MALHGTKPGFTEITTTTENEVQWGPPDRQVFANAATLDSTAVDAGNSPTSDLRPGLILGKQTTDGNLYQWNPDAGDGTEYPWGVLVEGISTLDAVGTAEDKDIHVLVAGGLAASNLLVEGTAFTSSAGEHLARRLMDGNFLFDDDVDGRKAGKRRWDYSVSSALSPAHDDNGTVYILDTGDITVTLPALRAGLVYEFVLGSDNGMTIICASGALDNMVVGNDLTADSVTFTTAGQQIGVTAKVESIFFGTTLKWFFTYQAPALGTGLGSGVALAIAT